MTDEVLTFKTIAEKYNLLERAVEEIFACYDTNDSDNMELVLSYCIMNMDKELLVQFMIDLLKYIKKCEVYGIF